MSRKPEDKDHVPLAHPEPACNTGYAEPKPGTKEQAQIPGGKRPPGDEEGGLDHDPDPAN